MHLDMHAKIDITFKGITMNNRWVAHSEKGMWRVAHLLPLEGSCREEKSLPIAVGTAPKQTISGDFQDAMSGEGALDCALTSSAEKLSEGTHHIAASL